ncbi:biliverdin-producing heme oxygenase [Mariniluteicoccus flavus]
MTAEPRTSQPLSDALRTATNAAHEAAEHSPFMTDLMSGRGSVEAYAALTGQLLHVYRALEAGVRAHAADPVVAPLADARLERVERLEADLRALGLDPGSVEALPATAAYAARLGEADAVALVAHHYVRYLGDLSGGQVVATMMGRHYGVTEAVTFYDFGELGKSKPYKDSYRAALDGLDLSDADRDRLVAEAVTAFELNQAVFADLAR